MKASLAVVLLAFVLTPVALAQSAPTGGDGIRTEAPVVVQGVLPGPGLWKVARDGHVMWVLGTQSPLPGRMQWRAQEVEDALEVSQEVLYPPSLQMSVDTGSFFRNLFLMPKLYGARKNPDGKTLREVLPAGLYARWLPLRQRYLGRGRGAERKRPLFAAQDLWEAALEDTGLVAGGIIWPVVERAIKRHDLRVTRPHRRIQVTDPKALLAEVEHVQLDDIGCMAATIERLEAGTGRLLLRANAWAIGDLDALKATPSLSQDRACTDAAIDSPMLRKRGAEGIRKALEDAWLAAAEQALARNESTFALLPIDDLLDPEGYLAALAARGFEVTPPR